MCAHLFSMVARTSIIIHRTVCKKIYIFLNHKECIIKNKKEPHEWFIVLFTHIQFGYKKS